MELGDHVKNILEDIIQHVEVKELDARKTLRTYINNKVISVIERNHQELEEKLKDDIKSEIGYINFDDDDFQREIRYFYINRPSENKLIGKRNSNDNFNPDPNDGSGAKIIEAVVGDVANIVAPGVGGLLATKIVKNGIQEVENRIAEEDLQQKIIVEEAKDHFDKSSTQIEQEEEVEVPLEELFDYGMHNNLDRRRRLDKDESETNSGSSKIWYIRDRIESGTPLSEKDKDDIYIFK